MQNKSKKEEEKKMRKSNCCNESLIVKTNLCSKCLKEVKISKLTAYDFKRDNVLGLPFNEEKLNRFFIN